MGLLIGRMGLLIGLMGLLIGLMGLLIGRMGLLIGLGVCGHYGHWACGQVEEVPR